jgi:hypothetical protein
MVTVAAEFFSWSHGLQRKITDGSLSYRLNASLLLNKSIQHSREASEEIPRFLWNS